MGPAWPLSVDLGEEEMERMSDTSRHFLEPLSAQNHLRPLGEEEMVHVVGGEMICQRQWPYDPATGDIILVVHCIYV